MEFLEKIENLQMFPSKREISRSNGRTGDSLSKRESPVQNGRVGMYANVHFSLHNFRHIVSYWNVKKIKEYYSWIFFFQKIDFKTVLVRFFLVLASHFCYLVLHIWICTTDQIIAEHFPETFSWAPIVTAFSYMDLIRVACYCELLLL